MKKLYIFLIAFCFSMTTWAADIFVDANNPNSILDGTTWETAFTSIKGALDKAVTGDRICIKNSSGNETVDLILNASYVVNKNITICGGFPKTNIGTNVNNFDPINERTRIEIDANEIDKPLFTVQNSVTFQGIHFYGGGNSKADGGAIVLEDITNTSNYSVLFRDCVFENNISTEGSSIYTVSNSFSVIIDNCFFVNNNVLASDQTSGSIVYLLNNKTLDLNNSVFYNNKCAASGGVIVFSNAVTNIVNCDFVENISFHSQVYIDNTVPQTIQNCIFFKGDGIKIESNNNTKITNCAFDDVDILLNSGSFNVNTNKWGITNPFINILDPIGIDGFWGTKDDGLRLSSNSELIDAGNANGSSTDITGNYRTVPYDIGAYEFGPCMNPLIVTKTTDNNATGDGECGDLRFAINYANKTSGPNEIKFAISGTGPFTLDLNAELPTITDELILDARSQSGYSEDKSSTTAKHQLMIQLDGSAKNIKNGLVINASNVTIRGFSIVGFQEYGIFAYTSNNVAIEGNFIGITTNGINTPNGVGIYFKEVTNSPNNYSYIGGGGEWDRNVISGNNKDGVYLDNSPGVSVIRNFIGIGIDGLSSLPNKGYGIRVNASSNVNIGTNKVGFRNVVAGNELGQIYVLNTDKNVSILDNYIGLGSDGISPISSPEFGVKISNAKKSIIGSVDFPNIIANSTQYGIQFDGTSALYNTISSNSIYKNGAKGISVGVGSQEDVNVPTINTAIKNSDGSVKLDVATATNINSISVYADLDNQGQVYLGEYPYSNTNTYTIPVAAMSATSVLTTPFNITATQTTTNGSTSEFSAPISITLNTPLAATAATNVTKTSFTANWTNSGATSYDLDVSTDPTFTSHLSGFPKTSISAQSILVDNLSPKTVYYYRVQETGSATWSNIKMTSTILPPGSGNALTFDGTNYVMIPNQGVINSLTDTYTIEAWINPKSWGSNKWDNGIVGNDGAAEAPNAYGFELRGGEGGQISFVFQATNTIKEIFSKNKVDVNSSWTHIAVSVNKNTASLYINGFLDNTLNLGTTNVMFYPKSPLWIGGSYDSNQDGKPERMFDGEIDEVRIWNIAKTENQIREQLCLKLIGSEPGLINYFRLDEGTGGKVENKARGSVEDGILIDSPTWGYSGAYLGDVATNVYSNAAGLITATLIDTDKFSSSFTASAANQGIHIIKVKEQPNTFALPNEISVAETFPYFGVFKTTASDYSVEYNYADNTTLNKATGEKNMVLVSRADNSSKVWLANGASLVDTQQDILTIAKIPLRSEYIVGFANKGEALDFDGVDDKVTVTNGSAMFANQKEITMEGWFFINDNSKIEGLLGIRNVDKSNYWIAKLVDGTIQARIITDVATANLDVKGVDLKVPHHYALVYDSKKMTFYIDGVIQGTPQDLTGIISETTIPFYIGYNFHNANAGSDWYLKGYADNVRIWSRALCKEEIKSNMNYELPSEITGLVAHYTFNQGIAGGNNAGANVLIDGTVNVNTGTLSGFELTGSTSNWIAPGKVVSGSKNTVAVVCPPPAPADLCAKASNGTITVTWSGLTNINDYVVYYGTTQDTTSITKKVVSGYTASLTGLTKDVLYYITVKAVGGEIAPFVSAVPVVESGRALDFSNADNGKTKVEVVVPYSDKFNMGKGAFTVESWFRYDTTASNGSNPVLVSYNDRDGSSGYTIGFEGKKLWVHIAGANYNPAIPVGVNPFDGKFHHYTISRDAGGKIYTYIDGLASSDVLSNIADLGYLSTDNAIGLYIGNAHIAPSVKFAGEIDEVRLWNVARTADEINDSKDFPLTGSETGLVGLWHFDEPSGGVAYDATCNGHNGNWTNNPKPVVSQAMFPYKPTGLKTTIANGKQTLSWDSNIAVDVKNYNVFKYNTVTSQWDSLTSVTTTNYDLASSCVVEKYKIYAQDQNAQKGPFSDEIIVQPYSSLDDGLRAHFKMDNTPKDEFSDINGTINPTITPTTDRHGNANSAYSFDGGNINTNQNLSFVDTESHTISVWVKAKAGLTTGKYPIFGRQGSSWVYILFFDYTAKYISFNSWVQGGKNGNPAINVYLDLNKFSETWHNLIVDFDKTTRKFSFYIDGNLIDSKMARTESIGASGDLYLGAGSSCSGCTFDKFSGAMDDFRIYNRLLKPEEIALLSERVVPEKQVICGEGTATTISPVAITGATYTWTNPTSSSAAISGNDVVFSSPTKTDAGTYSVEVKTACATFKSDIVVDIITVDTAVTKSSNFICNGNPVEFKFVATDADTIYWNYKISKTALTTTIRKLVGSTKDTVLVSKAGYYEMTKFKNGCLFAGSPIYLENKVVKVNLGTDIPTVCGPFKLLEAKKSGVTYEWYIGNAKQTNTKDTLTAKIPNTSYIVKIDSLGCTTADTISLGNFDQTVLELGKDTAVCEAIFTLKSPVVGNSYQWLDNIDKQLSTQQNHDVRISGLYKLSLTSTMGCVFRDSLTVQVGTTNIAGTVKAISTTICANDSIRLQTYNSSGDLLWQENAGAAWTNLTSETTDKLTLSASTKTSGVKYRVVAGASTTCPVYSDSVVFTISPAPVVDAGVAISTCELTPTIDLTGTSTNTNSTVWSSKGAGIFTNSASLTTKYTLSNTEITGGKTILYLKGLKATCPDMVDSVEVIVQSKTSPTVSLTVLESNICENQTISIQSVIVGALESDVNFVWTKNTLPFVGTTAIITDKAKIGDVYEVTITPKSVVSCIAETSIAKTFAASDFANCIPQFDLLPSKATVCPNEELSFTTTGVGSTYTWLINGETLSGKTVNYTFTTSGSKDITLTIDGVERNEIGLVSVTNLIIPSIASSQANRMSCENGAPVVLTVSGLTNLQWYKEEGTVERRVFAATQTSFEVFEPGFYCAKGLVSGCPVIVPKIEVLDGNPKPTISGTTELTSSTAPSYQWWVLYKGEMRAIVGATSNTYTPLYNGNYFVETINNYCRRMSDMKGITQANLRLIDENDFAVNGNEIFIENIQTSLRLHPNPAHDNVMISYSSPYKGNIDIHISTVTGRDVLQQTVEKQIGAYQLEFETGQQDSNVLIIRIQEGSNYHYEKLILY